MHNIITLVSNKDMSQNGEMPRLCVCSSQVFFFLHLLSLWNVVSTELMSWSWTATQYACDWAGPVSIPSLVMAVITYAPMCWRYSNSYYTYYYKLSCCSEDLFYNGNDRGRGLRASWLQRWWYWPTLRPMSFSCLEATKRIRALHFVGFLLNLCPNVSMALLRKNLYVAATSPPWWRL